MCECDDLFSIAFCCCCCNEWIADITPDGRKKQQEKERPGGSNPGMSLTRISSSEDEPIPAIMLREGPDSSFKEKI